MQLIFVMRFIFPARFGKTRTLCVHTEPCAFRAKHVEMAAKESVRESDMCEEVASENNENSTATDIAENGKEVPGMDDGC